MNVVTELLVICTFYDKLRKKIVDFYVLFLRRVHSPDHPPLESNPLSTDYETRAPTNVPPGTITNMRYSN